MLQLLRGDPEAITRSLPLVMLPAILGCFVIAQFGGFGILTCVHLFAFSVSAASMSEYKTERGLWMLALLFASLWTCLIAMWMYGQFLDIRRGVAFNGWIAIDAFFATFLMRLMVRFLWKTACLNYRISINTD